jgi:hypothetical protein
MLSQEYLSCQSYITKSLAVLPNLKKNIPSGFDMINLDKDSKSNFLVYVACLFNCCNTWHSLHLVHQLISSSFQSTSLFNMTQYGYINCRFFLFLETINTATYHCSVFESGQTLRISAWTNWKQKCHAAHHQQTCPWGLESEDPT